MNERKLTPERIICKFCRKALRPREFFDRMAIRNTYWDAA